MTVPLWVAALAVAVTALLFFFLGVYADVEKE